MSILKKIFFIFIIILLNLTIINSVTIDGEYDVLGSNPTGGTYQGTVVISKSGSTYNFKWNVGESYTGSGSLSNNTLTINWGDQYPVIYTVKADGRILIGTWSNGSAIEILSKKGPERDVKNNVEGKYNVTGSNPTGGIYKGTVVISKSGSTYNFKWNVGESYTGSGSLSNNTLTIDWGDQYPVIYLIKEGGNILIGTWGNGGSVEILSK